MTTASTTSANPFSGLGFQTTEAATVSKTTTNNKNLGQEQFLKLMTTQLTHQDPTKPMENGEFLTQMAQFGTVAGIQDLQKSFADFATSINSDQALQASSLVGRMVSTPSDTGKFDEQKGYLSGTFDLPSSSSSVVVKIIDPKSGSVVQTIDMGQKSAGRVAFVWDGKDSQGNAMASGLYKVQPETLVDGKTTALQANVDATVNSVSLGGSKGIQLNLDGLGAVSFSSVKEIL